MASIGRVLLIPKGDYSGSATYNSLDWVRDNGAAWVCKVDGTVGIAPPTLPTTSNANWQLLSADGSVSGSVAWSSVTGKPFATVDSSDFSVDGSSELNINRGTYGKVRVVSDSSGSPTTTDLEASGDATITLQGGSNVTISADDSSNPKKITINSTGGGGGLSNAFDEVVVGATTIAASGGDTLTLSAGTNVTLTPNASTKTVEISASGGGTVDQTFNGASTNAQSGVAISGYTNTFTYRRTKTGTGATGVGTWTDKDISQITSADEADWWYDAAFVIPSGVDEDSIDIKFLFEPLSDGMPIGLGGYIWDTTTGKICIKFANDITDYMATAKVAVDITYTRNEVV